MAWFFSSSIACISSSICPWARSSSASYIMIWERSKWGVTLSLCPPAATLCHLASTKQAENVG